jgi:arylsulfatase
VRLLLPVAALVVVAGGCSAPAPDHVILISVDTLRADRLGAYGYADAATPNLDALAAESLRFDRAYAHASSTLPSVSSLMTGLLPAQHGLFANLGKLRRRFSTLGTRLRAAGFRTAAFVGSWALRPTRGLARGFEVYTEEWGDRESNRPQPETRGAPLTDQAIAWLDGRSPGERLFLWVHYQEPHGPYEPPAFEPPEVAGPELPRSSDMSGRGAIPRYQWLGHGRLAEYEARYDGEIAEVDRQLGRLLAVLRERGLLAHSIVVFTADHGEAFGEDGLYCAHGEGLDESLLRVPLILRAPGLEPGVRRDAVRLIDVAPTLLALLGLPRDGLPGLPLTEDLGDRPVVAQVAGSKARQWRSLREDGFELVEGSDGTTLRPLARDSALQPVPAALRSRLEAQLERLARWPPAPRKEIAIDPDAEDLLRAMGYID